MDTSKPLENTEDREASLVDNVFLGTSGWSYEEWVGPFYVDRKRMFREYTRVLEV